MPEPYEARDLSGAESGTGSGAVDASGKLSSGEDLLSSEGPRSPLRAVFVGREGLRAGWGALLFAVQLLAMSLLVQSVLPACIPWPTPGAAGHAFSPLDVAQ